MIKFPVAKQESGRNTHSHAFNRSTLGHWVKKIAVSKTGNAELHHLPHSDRPVTAVSPDALQYADAISRED
jgi:hypothetical protein